MTIVVANGKAYYNAYNFAIGTDPAEPAFAAPSSTAIVNTITTSDSAYNIYINIPSPTTTTRLHGTDWILYFSERLFRFDLIINIIKINFITIIIIINTIVVSFNFV